MTQTQEKMLYLQSIRLQRELNWSDETTADWYARAVTAAELDGYAQAVPH